MTVGGSTEQERPAARSRRTADHARTTGAALEHREELAEFFASATVESVRPYLASEQLLQQRDPEGRTPLGAARSAGMKRLLSGGAAPRDARE